MVALSVTTKIVAANQNTNKIKIESTCKAIKAIKAAQQETAQVNLFPSFNYNWFNSNYYYYCYYKAKAIKEAVFFKKLKSNIPLKIKNNRHGHLHLKHVSVNNVLCCLYVGHVFFLRLLRCCLQIQLQNSFWLQNIRKKRFFN